jgi:hypothetical protein
MLLQGQVKSRKWLLGRSGLWKLEPMQGIKSARCISRCLQVKETPMWSNFFKSRLFRKYRNHTLIICRRKMVRQCGSDNNHHINEVWKQRMIDLHVSTRPERPMLLECAGGDIEATIASRPVAVIGFMPDSSSLYNLGNCLSNSIGLECHHLVDPAAVPSFLSLLPNCLLQP